MYILYVIVYIICIYWSAFVEKMKKKKEKQEFVVEMHLKPKNYSKSFNFFLNV